MAAKKVEVLSVVSNLTNRGAETEHVNTKQGDVGRVDGPRKLFICYFAL